MRRLHRFWHRFRFLALAVGPPLLLYLALAAWHAARGTPLLRGDCPYYYATARSLIDDGDLSLAGQISRSPVHSGLIALDDAGRPVAMHPPLLPIFALPAIAAFGPTGALVFNLLQLACLLATVHLLAARLAPAAAAAAATAATGVATFLPAYAWTFSPDVLTTLLFVAALAALPPDRGLSLPRHWVAGLALGLACFGKLSLLSLTPAVLLLAAWRWRPLAALAAGAALPLVLFALLNLHLFGSPSTTSYDRIAHFEDGGVRLHSTRDDFNQPFAAGLAGQAVAPQRGLVWTAPLALVGLAGLPLVWRRRPRLALAVGWVAVVLPLIYARYDWWWTSEYGNRFLLPLVALAALPLATLIAAAVSDGAAGEPVLEAQPETLTA